MKLTITSLLIVLLFSGCSRGPKLDEEGSLDLVYERLHGQGRTTDFLHITTDYQDPKNLPHPHGQILSEIYRVHPNLKKLFMHQAALSLKRNRVDQIGHPATNVADISMWRLQVRANGIEIEAIIYDNRDPEKPVDSIWKDRDFSAMRSFVSDMRLMGELYAIEMPDQIGPINEDGVPPVPIQGAIR